MPGVSVERDDAFDGQIPDSRPIFPVTLEDGFIQRQRKLCPRSQRFTLTRIPGTPENLRAFLQDFMEIDLFRQIEGFLIPMLTA